MEVKSLELPWIIRNKNFLSCSLSSHIFGAQGSEMVAAVGEKLGGLK